MPMFWEISWLSPGNCWPLGHFGDLRPWAHFWLLRPPRSQADFWFASVNLSQIRHSINRHCLIILLFVVSGSCQRWQQKVREHLICTFVYTYYPATRPRSLQGVPFGIVIILRPDQTMHFLKFLQNFIQSEIRLSYRKGTTLILNFEYWRTFT